MSYEFYKLLHLIMIMSFIVLVAIQMTQNENSKLIKILSGVSSFFILVAGMGLLARIGVSHGAGFPAWVWIKMVIWLALAVAAPILVKRLTHKRKEAMIGVIVLASVATYMAINKPF